MSKIRTAMELAKSRAALNRSNGSLQGDSVSTLTKHRMATPPSRPLMVGSAPRIAVDQDKFEDNKLLTHDSVIRHPAEGPYRMLRTRLMRVMRSNGWQILGVSSLGQNEGKSFTSINLAISIAAEVDQEVVLIDLDLRRPSVHGYLGVAPDDFIDLKDYLEDDKLELDNLIVCPQIDRLACILSSNSLERPSDVLASARGTLFFTELRERLSPGVVVIVDLPPLLAADDALAVAPMLDAFILVVAEGQAERGDVADVQPLLMEFNHIGTVLNKSIERDNKRANYY